MQATRSFLSRLICAWFLATALLRSSTGQEPVAPPVNLLKNAAFENGMEGWASQTWGKDATIAIDPNETHAGHASVRIDHTTAADSSVNQTVFLKPSTRYRLTGWVKAKQVVKAEGQRNGAAGASLCILGGYQNTVFITDAKEWAHLSMDFTTGANQTDSKGVKLGPRLGHYGKMVTGSAWFAEISLIELGPGTATPAPRPIAGSPPGKPGIISSTPHWREVSRLSVIEAWIDGPTELRVTKTGIYWISRSEKPGKHDGLNQPTYVDNHPWQPEWKKPGTRGADISNEYPLPSEPGKLQFQLIAATQSRGGTNPQRRDPIKTKLVDGEYSIFIPEGQSGACWYKFVIGDTPPLIAADGTLIPTFPPGPAIFTARPSEPHASASAALSTAELVNTHRSNLVFVTTADGAGSGFIANYGKGTFLITNAHVAADAKGAVFKTLEGTQVQIGAPASAVGHDIFLMALPPRETALQVMTGVDENAAIGDAIVVLGNAEGAGVINTIQGKIVGLGPNLVEVDAPFQPGNSGSPIIHLKTGKVIGVATYLTIRKYDNATKEPVKDPVVRRFGYRLDSVKAWQPVNWPTFFAQAAEMRTIEKLTDDLVTFLQDLSKDGNVTRGAHTNPAIKSRIDAWLEAKSKRLSPRDAAMADQSMLSFLKVTCQSDITAAHQRLTYDYFQRILTDQQRERTEISGILGKIIENVR
jgi:hypothetical protein